jgi:hypothetical protein
MRAGIQRKLTIRASVLLALAAAVALVPRHAAAWGRSAHRLVVDRAIDTLPLEIRVFFEANRAFLLQHVTDPLDALAKAPAEKRNNHLYLDKYGRFPFDLLPRNYKAAVDKYGKSKLQSNGVLPWQIGVYSQKLTEDMKASRWEEAKLDAAFLASYVAAAHDPFSTSVSSGSTSDSALRSSIATLRSSPCGRMTRRSSTTPRTTHSRSASTRTVCLNPFCWRIATRTWRGNPTLTMTNTTTGFTTRRPPR